MAARPVVLALLLLTTAGLRAQPAELFGRAGAEADGAALPDGFTLVDVAAGATFDTPTAVAVAPDGRLFVTEKRGRVYVIEDGVKRETPFLDLEDEVLDSGDRGLLGLAFDPAFADNGHVYLYYTVDFEETADRYRYDAFARLTRYTADAADPNVADPASRFVLLGETFATGVPACHTSHNGGTLLFGADGTLLLSTGDAASFGPVDAGGLYDVCFGPGRIDPAEDIGAFRAGRIESLAGKILRLDPATGRGLPSNPFYTGDPDDTASKVWAMGLRNPFRMALRPGGSLDPADGDPGTLYLADVGWNTWEELQPAHGGEYFGWPCFEGPNPQGGYQAAAPATNGCETVPAPTRPTHFWHHDDHARSFPSGLTGSTLVSGAFYEGTRYPAPYRGALFYGDFTGRWMAFARVSDDGRLLDHTVFDTGGFVVDVVYDPVRDALLVVDAAFGLVQRLHYADPGGNHAPVAIAAASPPEPVATAPVHFDGGGSLDADGDALTYAWAFGDGEGSDLPSPDHAFAEAGRYTVRLTVTDPSGASGTTQLAVPVGEVAAPRALLLAPADGAAVRPGETLTLVGEATDSDQPAATLQYQWAAVQHHDGHTHPIALPATGPTASFAVPAHGAAGDAVWYRVTLTVTDDDGLTDTAGVALYVRLDAEVDATERASAPIARVTAPQGSGSRDLETIRDGVRPAPGPCDSALQYDTYTGPGGTEGEDWIGYAFDTPQRFVRLSFQEGCHFPDGGWFEDLRVEVRRDETWTAAPFLGVFPAYRGADGAHHDTYALVFRATEGDAIRLIGTPGGAARFVSVAELRAFTLGDVPPDLSDWTSADVGPVAAPGGVALDGSAFVVDGAGDLWGDLDRFHFVYQTLRGDGALTVRLDTLAAEAAWAKAGVMARASLDPRAPHAMLVGTAGRGVHLQHRPEAGAATAWLGSDESAQAPVWLRLQRLGDRLTGYVSADGEAWRAVGTAAVALGEDVLLGMAVAAADAEGLGATARARFSEVAASGVLDPDPPDPGAAPPGTPFGIDRVYPNPFRAAATVRLAVERPGVYRVAVYDVLGRRVLTRSLRAEAPGLREVRLDLGGTASGTYLVRAFRLPDGPVATARVTRLGE